MMHINFSLSAEGAFASLPHSTDAFGFIVSLAIGATDCRADLQLPAHRNIPSLSVVAALLEVRWDGGPTDPIRLSGLISPQNRTSLSVAVPRPERPVEIAFVIYEFDATRGEYFQTFGSPDTILKAKLQLGPDGDSTMVTDPSPAGPGGTHPFRIAVVPSVGFYGQAMHFAPAPDRRQQLMWFRGS